MPYDKSSRDENGAIVNATAPRGMSGGAVIDAGRPGELSVFLGETLPRPLLAGVVIELKKKRMLLSTRMGVIMPVLLEAFPAPPKA